MEMVFQGRGGIWKSFLEDFRDEPIVAQMLGTFIPANLSPGLKGGVHNDFLMNLNRYGYIGLIIYIIIIILMVKYAFIEFRKWIGKTPKLDSMIFLSGALTILWIIHSMGFHTSMYPSLMLILFGVFGLIFFEIGQMGKVRGER